MKLIMKETHTGSPNGIDVISYEKGKEYNIPESLFNVFVYQLRVATPVPIDIPPLSKEAIDGRQKQAFVEAPDNKGKGKGKKSEEENE